MSLAVKELTGEEPDAVMADYRNSDMPRIQDTRQAVAVETRAALFNPEFIRERMKGGATTASQFGEMFRNVFGWTVLRQSALDENIYNDLFDTYIADQANLGIREYFDKVNPSAYQEMLGTMLESARKGYWKASATQLSTLSRQMAETTDKHGAPCTEFVCGNAKLQQFVASNLSPSEAGKYKQNMASALACPNGQEVVLKEQKLIQDRRKAIEISGFTILFVVIVAALIIVILIRNRRRSRHE